MALSEPENASILDLCDDLHAAASAAELQLAMAAVQILPHRAVVRVFRESARAARIRTQGSTPGARRREEDTEELLGAALGALPIVGDRPADLDDGPEGSADLLLPIDTEEGDSDTKPSVRIAELAASSSLVEFDEESEETPALDVKNAPTLVEFDEESEETPAKDVVSASSSMVSFDEHEEVTPVPTVVPVQRTAAPPSSSSSLVQFDEPPVGEFDDDNATTIGSPVRASETFDLIGEDDGEMVLEDDEDEGNATVVQSLAQLPSLAEFLGQNKGADDEEQDPSSVAEVIVKKSEVASVRARTDVSNTQVPPRPESPRPVAGKAGAPPRPSATPRPAPTASRPGEPRTAAVSAVPTPRTVAAVAAVPKVRDSQGIKPRAAAIQLNAGGGGRVVGEEEEPLELGEAEGDLGESSGGFSVDLVDYEGELDPDDSEELDLQDSGVLPRPLEMPSKAEQDRFEQLGRAEWEESNFDAAIEYFSDAIDANDGNFSARLSRGRLHLEKGDFTSAMSDFVLAEEAEPNSAEPQVAIGELYFARKDYRKAVDYFDAALSQAPNHAKALCNRGISQYCRKNFNDALEDLLRAQKLDPEIPSIDNYVRMAKQKSGPARR